MLIGITNTPRDYAWGSTTAIAALTGRPASGGPEAELWFGAHPAHPSTVTAGRPGIGGRPLDALIAADPAAYLGPGRSRLPFLLKILAADRPLSLQVHPDPEQAREGFAREQQAGIPLDSPSRNYVDDSAKPEVILALSPTFEALAGFRHVSETRLLLAELARGGDEEQRARIDALGARLAAGDPARAGSTGSSAHVVTEGMPDSAETAAASGGDGNPLADTVAWLLHGGDDVERTIAAVVAAAARMGEGSSFAREWATVAELAGLYPGDPGVVLSLLLNRVSLAQGQVLSLPAGNMHAYLRGVGVELMSASDNVLRGGLTPKHVDVDELLRIVRFESLPTPIVRPDEPVAGIEVFRPESDDFVLAEVGLGDVAEVEGYRLSGPESTSFLLTGPAIVLCLDGALTLVGALGDALELRRGEAAYVTPDERSLTLRGSAFAVLATTP